MEIIIFLSVFTFGILLGYAFLPRAKQKTKVTIENGIVSFKSNRLQNGDEYSIYINGELVSSGEVKNSRWC